MPTYEYECDACHRQFEIRQRISEDPLTVCEVCGGRVRRLLSAAPFILKGAGWYVTDYPSESRKKAMDAEKSTGTKPADSKTSESKPSDSKASESKSDDSKSGETKPASTAATTASSSGSASSSD